MNQASLLWGLLFGSIGTGFFLYGKKRGHFVLLLCGMLLIVFPFFVSNNWLLAGIGTLLVATPYFIRS